MEGSGQHSHGIITFHGTPCPVLEPGSVKGAAAPPTQQTLRVQPRLPSATRDPVGMVHVPTGLPSSTPSPYHTDTPYNTDTLDVTMRIDDNNSSQSSQCIQQQYRSPNAGWESCCLLPIFHSDIADLPVRVIADELAKPDWPSALIGDGDQIAENQTWPTPSAASASFASNLPSDLCKGMAMIVCGRAEVSQSIAANSDSD